ncbi:MULTISPECIES: LysR substrate-binding domain-containing protein [unclassified Acinetobacter]|uniref:LysR substrate-binding domain-containing protein n=1 Tax=unclassified Acinetobacter TaxID=196816 RepID=UPI0029341745|nr:MULTISPECIES: LysR substrate-binding domain-containing protein [unclassified Acinetobacter]WOE31722.1 LysR substrate-binding domain-containing protein [Acinetobacter sp. SAAs470]WOE37189.1 LysR substrate-binding domain-containing protein [Acinetobacter sp. SAAs474]
MNNLPNLSDLKVFCVVAKRKSFVASADELGASPAYVSKRINILENNLNCTLFHRSTRHVSLTEDGKLILERVSNILNEFDELNDLINNPQNTPTGRIDIVSSFGFGRSHVAPILSKLMTMYPELDIQFNTIDHAVDLIQHSLDLDIFVGNDISPNMIAKKLLPNFRILCASPRYLQIHSEPDDLDELANHYCLAIQERDQSRHVWKLRSPMEDLSISIAPKFTSNNSEIIKQLVIDDQGIMLCSVWDVMEELLDGKLQHILTSYWQDADIWAVYPSRLRSSSKLKTCILFIQAQLLSRLQYLNSLTRGKPILAKTDQPIIAPEKVFL